jgi:hypothetical protein
MFDAFKIKYIIHVSDLGVYSLKLEKRETKK